MTITFEKIRLCNFLSFGDSEILLDVPGYTLVSGINNSADDFASSNGSGKSSIWEAISWVLTGETIRGCKNVTNINGDDGALVELTFEVDGDEYIVTRTKDHSKLKSNLKILINGVDKSGKGIRDGEKLLEEYLPEVTSSLLGSVIILGQGLPQKFTANTPSGRKEVLEKLSKSDFMIEDIKNRISVRIDAFASDKRILEQEQIKLSTKRDILLSTKAEALDKLARLENESELRIKLAEVNDDIQKETSVKNNIEEELSKVSANINDDTSEYVKLSDEKSNKNQIIADKHQHIIDAYKEQKFDIQTRISQLRNSIIQKESVVDVCPTCGQKLPNVQKLNTSEDKKLLSTLIEESEALNSAYDEAVSNKVAELKEVADLIDDQILGVKSELANLRELSHNLNVKLIESKKRLDVLNKNQISISSKIQLVDVEQEHLIGKIDDCDSEISNLDDKILYIKNEMDTISEHLDVLNKMNTFIKRDFRGYLLHNVIDYLDSKVKMYCNDIYGHENLNFALDGNNISISINGKEYEQLSGGEKQKVDLIVQLAIRDMLCKYTNFSSNIFVLDEIFDNLDAVGSEQVLNMLSKRLEDVSSTYIVTHHSSIEIPVDRQLLVVKDATGISKVEEE